MRLAKTSSISAKFEILTCKNFSFHGNLNDRKNMAKDFQNSVEKTARAKGNYQDMGTANVQRSGSLFRRLKVKAKDTVLIFSVSYNANQLG